jgi:hypothetical protein
MSSSDTFGGGIGVAISEAAFRDDAVSLCFSVGATSATVSTTSPIFAVASPGDGYIFFSSLTNRQNKLERLSLASFLSYIYEQGQSFPPF